MKITQTKSRCDSEWETVAVAKFMETVNWLTVEQSKGVEGSPIAGRSPNHAHNAEKLHGKSFPFLWPYPDVNETSVRVWSSLNIFQHFMNSYTGWKTNLDIQRESCQLSELFIRLLSKVGRRNGEGKCGFRVFLDWGPTVILTCFTAAQLMPEWILGSCGFNICLLSLASNYIQCSTMCSTKRSITFKV